MMKVTGAFAVIFLIKIAVTVDGQNNTTMASNTTAASNTAVVSNTTVAPSTTASPLNTTPAPNTTAAPNTTVAPSTTVAPTTKVPSTSPPATTDPPTATPSKDTEVSMSLKIEGIGEDKEQEILTNETARKAFEEEFSNVTMEVLQNKTESITIKEIKVNNIRQGSLIVDFSVIIDGSSDSNAQQVINIVEKEKNGSSFGRYTVNSTHSLNAKVTKIDTVNSSTNTPTEEPSQVLLIALCVGLALLIIIVILMLILVCYLAKLLKRK